MPEDQALERLRAILARPEYQVEDVRPWWEQLLAPVWDLLRYLIEQLILTIVNASTGREGWVGSAVLVACVVLIGLMVAYLVRAIRISVRGETRLASQTLAERRERSGRLWQTAHELAAGGKWSEAVRVVYLSALYALDERALLHVETALTNREHVRQLQRLHPELGGSFAEVVERYDLLRYGRAAASASTFAELSDLVARARDAALGGAGAA